MKFFDKVSSDLDRERKIKKFLWRVHKKNYIPLSRQILQDCLDLVALLRLSHIHRLILHLGEAQVVNKPKSEYINT